MSDPRLTPFNGRVAHTSLEGHVDAKVFTEGTTKRVWFNTADLRDKPGGARQCQLLYGEKFRVLEESEFDAFGFRELDGYVGWVPKMTLKERHPSPLDKSEVKVAVQRAPFLTEPDIKSPKNNDRAQPLSFGSLLWHRPYSDQTKEDKLAKDGWLLAMRMSSHSATAGFIRRSHVVPADHFENDPAGIAALFIHTPYVWGGDSSFGIDCSGLVQRALMSCGKKCPRDSDMQFKFFNKVNRQNLQRGDLVFWKGHVGMMLDDKTLIHANAHHMMVATEALNDAIRRIGAKEFGEVIGYARP